MADVAVARARRPRLAPLADLRAAVAFLTRVPVAGSGHAESTTGAAAFPIVGALLGALGAIPLVGLGADHPVIAAILAVATIAILDGGLHLDGLADTVDALAAPADRAERARTDPQVGSAGVAAIVVVLAAEVAASAELAGRGLVPVGLAWIAAGACSRALSPLLALSLGRRRPAPSGLGSWFVAGVTAGQATLAASGAVVVLLASVLLGGSTALAAGVIGGTIAASVLAAVTARIRGHLDGDGYGFAIESCFAAILVACAVAA